MKLSQLFSAQTHIEEQTNAKLKADRNANTAYINRQIRSLVPGQTVSGEIVGRNGSEVQIRLSEDMVLNARVDKSLNIEIGKNMTFEVKNNGSTLTLSPLFTNISTDVNVLKALEMASLPVNQTSVAMTEQLMEAGLPVNRNTLQQVYREINNFPQAEISDIIHLHRLQMPVNEANVNQMVSYRSLNHQLLEGMENVLDALPEVFDSLRADGDYAGAVKLYQEIFQLAEEGTAFLQDEQTAGAAARQTGQSGQLEQTEPGVQAAETEDPGALKAGTGAAGQSKAEAGALEQPQAGAEAAELLNTPGAAKQPDTAGELQAPEKLRQALAEEVLSMVKELPLSEEQLSEVTGGLREFAAGNADAKQLMTVLNRLAEIAGGGPEALRTLDKIFSQPAFKDFLNGQLKELWTLRPDEVAVPGRVEELYRRLDRQLKSLAQALESTGQSGSAAFKAVSNMTQNLDFLQQINQMYTYVQLPLRLQQGEAHGELYVYTNKKRLSDGDGKISALLHLDMENLGPVDVYVTLQNSKVNTKFYVQDDEMLDFLTEHMDLLTDRLRKRGYDCSFEMTTRGKEDNAAAKGGLEPVLQQEKGVVLSQYAFDVRT